MIGRKWGYGDGKNRAANRIAILAENDPKNQPSGGLVNVLDLLSKGDGKNYNSDGLEASGFDSWRCEVGNRLMIKQFLTN